MTKLKALLLLAAACAPLTLAAPAPTPPQKAFIVGTVRNEAGQPLTGATINADNLLVMLQKSRQKVPHPLRGWGTLEGTYGKATENVVTRTQRTDRAGRPAR